MMDDMSILEYYTNNATPEQTRLVNTIYSCDYIKTLMDLGFNGRKGLTMDEVYLLFLMVNLEKDLDSMQERMLELSVGDNEETFKEFIDGMFYSEPILKRFNSWSSGGKLMETYIENGNGNINLYIEKLNEELAKIIS